MNYSAQKDGTKKPSTFFFSDNTTVPLSIMLLVERKNKKIELQVLRACTLIGRTQNLGMSTPISNQRQKAIIPRTYNWKKASSTLHKIGKNHYRSTQFYYDAVFVASGKVLESIYSDLACMEVPGTWYGVRAKHGQENSTNGMIQVG